MLAQTHDSGSNNNTLAEAMQICLTKYSEDRNETFKWDHQKHRVRCVCHKLALMVNAGLQSLGIQAPPPPLVKSSILGQFPIPTHNLQSIPEEDESAEGGDSSNSLEEECEEGDSDEVDDTDIKSTQAQETANWYDVADGPHPEPEITSEDIEALATDRTEANAVYHLITKLDVIGRKIGGSAVMCCLFDALSLAMLNQKLPRPIPGYGIRWNIKLQCWRRLYNAREVIDQILKEDQMDPPRKGNQSNRPGETPLPPDIYRPRGIFNKVMITPDKWRQVRDLMEILEGFERLTKFFEQDGPTASLVIREYVKLKKKIQQKIDNTQSRAEPLFPMYHTILVRVEAYLKEALSSHTLNLATILHLSLRLDYFDFAFGSTSSETLLAKSLIEEAYQNKKADLEANGPYQPTVNSNGKTSGHGKSLAADDEDFLRHKALNRRNTANELRSYLEMAEEPAPEVVENPHLALAWWSVNEGKYPILSQLARDYLAISATACPVERTFSSAADVCTADRSSLLPRPIERLVLGRMWSVEGVEMKGKFTEANDAMKKCLANDQKARKRRC